jgi:dihydrodipicolinate synthase/N-acetylneuraminate lyase
MKRIGGMFANLPTPFSRDGGRIDFAVVRERIEWLIEAGIHGFSTQLSAGRSPGWSTRTSTPPSGSGVAGSST